MPTTYQIIDRQTGKVVSEHKTAAAARAKRDRLDLAYGACRYLVKLPVLQGA